MITEKFFVKTYNSFWQELFPSGNDYIRIINSSISEKVFEPLTASDLPYRRALINNIAFSIFVTSFNDCKDKSNVKELIEDKKLLKSITIREVEVLSNMRFGSKLSVAINDDEIQMIKEMSERLFKRYSKLDGIVLNPKFSGCGILFESKGDIFYKNTLVEVKAGDRNFSILDLRQLYVYLTLNHIGGNYKITNLELFNPRTGMLWNESVEEVSENIAGMSTIEVVQEILSYISNDIRSN